MPEPVGQPATPPLTSQPAPAAATPPASTVQPQPNGPQPAQNQPLIFAQPKRDNHFLTLAIVTFVISALFAVGFFGMSSNLKRQVVGVKQKIGALESQLKQPAIVQAASELDKISTKITIFQSVAQDRVYTGRLVTVLASRLPKNVQLTSVAFDENKNLKIDAKTEGLRDAATTYVALRDFEEVTVLPQTPNHPPSGDDMRFLQQAFQVSQLTDATVSQIHGCKLVIRYTHPATRTTSVADDAVLQANLTKIAYTIGRPQPVFQHLSFVSVSPPAASTSSQATGTSSKTETKPSTTISFSASPSPTLLEVPALDPTEYCPPAAANQSASPAASTVPTPTTSTVSPSPSAIVPAPSSPTTGGSR